MSSSRCRVLDKELIVVPHWGASCPPINIMGIAQGSREDAIRSLINVWLKLPQQTCANCGADWDGQNCCEFPVICNNETALRKFFEELREARDTRLNQYASNKDKSMRWGVSLPANLYHFLNTAMRKMYNEKLFTKKHDMTWFAKKFPQFKVPERI